MAVIGDWVIGTGGVRTHMTGRLIYAMRVTEAMTFEEYFTDPRFSSKKPNLHGSLKQCFGDNIYSRPDEGSPWEQLDSHHTLPDGSPNPENIATDTSTNRVLLSTEFTYFGRDAPMLPAPLATREVDGLCAGRNYRVTFEPDSLSRFFEWFNGVGKTGQVGAPFEWNRNGALVRS